MQFAKTLQGIEAGIWSLKLLEGYGMLIDFNPQGKAAVK
jgi:hypothetical protein